MLKTKDSIKNIKHLLLMWFVLFAFSPCVVKEALFSTVNTAYTQPLNKSKTTSLADACQAFQRGNRQISAPKRLNITTETQPVNANRNIAIHPVSVNRKQANAYTVNAPPKYILYKRLKLDAV